MAHVLFVCLHCERPAFPGKKHIDWDLRDPKDLPMAHVRAIRDEIKGRVNHFVNDLDHAGVRG